MSATPMSFAEEEIFRHEILPRYRGLELSYDDRTRTAWIRHRRTGRSVRVDEKTRAMLFSPDIVIAEQGRMRMQNLVHQIADPEPRRVQVWLGI